MGRGEDGAGVCRGVGGGEVGVGLKGGGVGTDLTGCVSPSARGNLLY